jgi:hypothetical protein
VDHPTSLAFPGADMEADAMFDLSAFTPKLVNSITTELALSVAGLLAMWRLKVFRWIRTRWAAWRSRRQHAAAELLATTVMKKMGVEDVKSPRITQPEPAGRDVGPPAVLPGQEPR